MKKIVRLLSIFLFLAFAIVQNASAYDETSTNNYVDKFKSTTGFKVKESNIAGKMEKATQDAAYGNKKEKKQWVKKRENKETEQENVSEERSYRWLY